MESIFDDPSCAAVRRMRREMRLAAFWEITINAVTLAALVAFAALFLVATPDSVNGDGETEVAE